MIERDELAAWLRLLETPGVGRETARRLLAAFGSPERVFDAPASALREIVNAPIASALSKPDPGFDALLGATLAWLSQTDDANGEHAILTIGDAAYPHLLLETADPPLLLYCRGRIDWLRAPAVAIVGSRNPTRQGADHARAFAAHLSRAGLTVVSGLALGVDGAAHDGALEGAGRTVAVVGTGLDRVYPVRHTALAQRIAADGLLVSEFVIGTPPLAQNFPQRNRIIAGLARGTLVVEAALRSGSLITARLASEAGRDVFAIPGSIHSPQSRGCHALIKQGAKLVECAEDVLEELQFAAPERAPTTAEPAAESIDDPLLEALGFDPVSLDALVARTGESPATLGARLLELELSGDVARLPGQLFQRIGRA